ncbi:MAG: hypothetical protein RMJ89_12700 [Flammeovirgaceae bacterium]|nr:hypothetical protein [Flammeovirgaceae bacterium]
MKKYWIISFLAVFLAACEGGSNERDSLDPGTGDGQGGSLARFAVAGDFLYTVDHRTLNTLNIVNAQRPIPVSKTDVGFNIETIFPRGNALFIGSQMGMYIYSLQDPSSPKRLSFYQHVMSCDPVVADNRYAYVTLRTGTPCTRGLNVLEILDIIDLTNPVLVASYPMTNPMGLGISGKTLFVCDDGLKVFDVTNVQNIRLLHHFRMPAIDVIPRGQILIVMSDDGIRQYEYVDGQMNMLSLIPVSR